MRLYISLFGWPLFFLVCLWTDILWWKMGRPFYALNIHCDRRRKKCKWKKHINVEKLFIVAKKRAELKRKFNAPSNHLSFLCDAHTQRLAFGCEWKVHWVSIFECRESKFSKKPNGNNIIINLLSFVRVKCAYKNAHHPNRNGNFI